MKRGFPSGTRSFPLDRSPLGVTRLFEGTALAPHAQTTRITYTVPAGKRFLLKHVYLLTERATAATTPATPQTDIFITGSAGTRVLFATLSAGNAARDRDKVEIATEIVFAAGDVIEGRTGDTSTGGTVSYKLGVGGIEYDA